MPIYRWTFPSETTDKELRACLEARAEWATRAPYHFAWVIDMSNITKAPALQRKAMAQHLKRFEQYGARYNAGSAIIVPSPWLRGLMTAVTWSSPPSFPYQPFSEPIEAEGWAKEQLAANLAELDGLNGADRLRDTQRYRDAWTDGTPESGLSLAELRPSAAIVSADAPQRFQTLVRRPVQLVALARASIRVA